MLSTVLALSKTQWSTLVTGRYMITMMVLLCYVNLSGMSLECIVIVLMNNLLLGGQECTDYVDIQQNGDNHVGSDILVIIPRLNFTCNCRITNIRASLNFNPDGIEIYPIFQVWRPASVGSNIYAKTGEVPLLSDDQVEIFNNVILVGNINLTSNNTIEVQSGDVVGYYHPSDPRFRVRTILTDGYMQYQFRGPAESVDLNNNTVTNNERQPLIQFNIGKCLGQYTDI